MYLLVTDRMECPRCGTGFGLILVADGVEDRRVHRGILGCSNCRDRYPVEDGFADLRPSPRDPAPEGVGAPFGRGAFGEGMLGEGARGEVDGDAEAALKIAALLGVREGPGFLLLSGPHVRHASRLAAMIDGIEILAVDPALRTVREQPGVTRMQVGVRLPFQVASLRGVVLHGEEGEALFDEGLRVLSPGGRLVYFAPPSSARTRMETARMELLLEADTVLVGALK